MLRQCTSKARMGGIPRDAVIQQSGCGLLILYRAIGADRNILRPRVCQGCRAAKANCSPGDLPFSTLLDDFRTYPSSATYPCTGSPLLSSPHSLLTPVAHSHRTPPCATHYARGQSTTTNPSCFPRKQHAHSAYAWLRKRRRTRQTRR